MSHHLNNQMASGSDLFSTKPELSGLKNHNNKIISDYESAWSPTSPLDLKMFSSFVNPFGCGSILKGHQKSWDSEKVGLSIVDSLDDHHHTDSLPSPDSKNIIFGSTMRTRNPKCQNPHLPSPVVEENNNAYEMIKQASGSLDEDIGSDIEISEDYTCVISHGPNPKTTHFYGDQVLELVEENGLKKLCCENKKESIFVIAPLDITTTIDVLPSNDFFTFCCFCSKKLDMDKDIYMYRGYKAFCSSECRSEEIQLDDKMEGEEEAVMSDSSSDEDMPKKKSNNNVIFTIG